MKDNGWKKQKSQRKIWENLRDLYRYLKNNKANKKLRLDEKKRSSTKVVCRKNEVRKELRQLLEKQNKLLKRFEKRLTEKDEQRITHSRQKMILKVTSVKERRTKINLKIKKNEGRLWERKKLKITTKESRRNVQEKVCKLLCREIF